MSASRPRVVLAWGLALLVLVALALPRARIIGDGREYLLYAQAFATHLSPDIRPADIERVAGLMERTAPGFREMAAGFGNEETIGGLRYGRGFVTAPDGRLYSWHFWLYPMLVAPLLVIVQALGLAPAAAFTLFNGLCLAGALAYLLLRWQAPPWARFLLGGVFLLSGTTYYLWWSHPEVWTASLLLLALMMASDRRHGAAMLASALAATQNPPLVLLLAGIGVLGLAQRRRAGEPMLAPAFVMMATASLAVAALPALFFGATLGVLNPIAAGGAADPGLIGIARLWSMVGDLNLGLVAGAPGVLIGLALLPVLAALRARRIGADGLLAPGLALLACVAISVAMAVPALATTNWNHGQTVFSRYAYWLGVPLVFGLVVGLQAIGPRTRLALGALVVVTQLLTVAYHGVFGQTWRGDYLAFKPLAAWVMRHHPDLHNPMPEIFIERLTGRELPAGHPSAPREVYAFPSAAAPVKVLVSARRAEAVVASCPAPSIVVVEGGWRYLNLRPGSPCSLPEGS